MDRHGVEAIGMMVWGRKPTRSPKRPREDSQSFRLNILEAQYQACKQLEKEGLITGEDIHNIFHGNIKRLIGESW